MGSVWPSITAMGRRHCFDRSTRVEMRHLSMGSECVYTNVVLSFVDLISHEAGILMDSRRTERSMPHASIGQRRVVVSDAVAATEELGELLSKPFVHATQS